MTNKNSDSSKTSPSSTGGDVILGDLHKQSLQESEKQQREDRGTDLDRSLSLALGAAEAMIEKKAENVKILDVAKTSGFTDYFIICSAMNERQVAAITESVSDHLRTELKAKPLSVEGQAEARWVLMDYGDVLVHVFLDALRDYYDLEGKWNNAKRVEIPARFYEPAAAPSDSDE